MNFCINVGIYQCTDVFMHVYMYVCIFFVNLCMYVCMYVVGVYVKKHYGGLYDFFK